MPLAALLFALSVTVSEPRIPAGGPGVNATDASVVLTDTQATKSISATLDAPARTPLLSTGFPFTEGTRLLRIESDAPVIRLRYLFPMRGTYALSADATHADGTHSRAIQTITVPEDPRVVRTLASFVVALLVLGATAGYLLGAGTALRPLVPHAATIVLLAALCAPALAMPMAASGTGPLTGTLWPIAVNVAGPAVFEVVARNVEDVKPLIAVALAERNGRLRMGLQFYDGAQHELRIRALRAGKPLHEWTQRIEVRAQPPPFARRAIALGWMLSVFALGYASGIGLQARRSRYR